MKSGPENKGVFVTGPRMYGCRDSLPPKEKSPSTNEKGTTNDEKGDTGSTPMTFSDLVRELEKKE